jgi:hypothetical protein
MSDSHPTYSRASRPPHSTALPPLRAAFYAEIARGSPTNVRACASRCAIPSRRTAAGQAYACCQMARDWESWFQTAAQPASPTEEAKRDRTEQRIREAIHASPEIPNSSIRIYVKGSYKTGTNVRQDADVDVCVEWQDFFYVDTWGETTGMGPSELNYTPAEPSSLVEPADFRARIERALVARFGPSAVDMAGAKAIDVAAGTDTLDADAIPSFRIKRYDTTLDAHEGQRIFPKSGGAIDNFPQQNYDNGVTKNKNTALRYKKIVRCLKKLENELYEDGGIPREYPGYLIECLAYNVPDTLFRGATLTADVNAALVWIWDATETQEKANELLEVNRLLRLFRGRPDRIVANAHRFAGAAWVRIQQ